MSVKAQRFNTNIKLNLKSLSYKNSETIWMLVSLSTDWKEASFCLKIFFTIEKSVKQEPIILFFPKYLHYWHRYFDK